MPSKEQGTPGQHLNYDTLAEEYNRRYEESSDTGISAALNRLVRQTKPQRILEAGCGTAHWLRKIQPTGNYNSVRPFLRTGLDLSFGMLSQAEREADYLPLVQGQAEILPFRTNVFDLVYCVNAVHHFSDPAAFILEAKRILQTGGRLAILGNNPHDPHTRWYVYDYFEDIYKKDLKRFPTKQALTSWIHAAGFTNLEWSIAEHIHAPWVGKTVFDDPFLEKNMTSQLAALSEAAYRQGIRKIQAAIEDAIQAGEEIVFQTELDIYILTAVAPD